MLKVAVTGGAGSGKTAVCNHFGRLGADVIDLDALAREAVEPGSPVLRAIVNHFGSGVLGQDGGLDRSKLRRIITRDAKARRLLERLTHPEIFRLFEARVVAIESRHRGAILVTEVPLLIELGMQGQFDVVVLVEATQELQKGRLVGRNGSSAEEAQALLDIQMETERKRAYADYIVMNTGSIEEMEIAVEEIYRKIAKGA